MPAPPDDPDDASRNEEAAGETGMGVLSPCISWSLIPELVGFTEWIFPLPDSDVEFERKHAN